MIHCNLSGLDGFEVEMIAVCELLGCRFDDIDDVAVSAGVGLEESVFLDELLDALQSGAVLEAFQNYFGLVDPRVHVVDAGVELLLLPGLRQLHRLHLGGRQQLLPHLYHLLQVPMNPNQSKVNSFFSYFKKIN